MNLALHTLAPGAGRPLLSPADHGAGHRGEPREELLRVATIARELGSGLVSAVLAAAAELLPLAPRLAGLMAEWPGDPRTAAMALRFNAGLHALARRGTIVALSAYYAGDHDDAAAAVAAALEQGEDTLIDWMGHLTQTNEVMRSGAIMAALMTLADRRALPFELLEIGASAGLNLILDRYEHQLGGVEAGTAGAPVRIAPNWRGPPPPSAAVTIAAARGTDLRPLSVHDPRACERLLSYVWADDAARMRNLSQAIDLARACPPRLDRRAAGDWLTGQLAQPQQDGRWRVVIHSMVAQYLPSHERRAVRDALDRAAAQATPDRPLAVIGFEWNPRRTEVRLGLTHWSGPGAPRRQWLARCHAYGWWIDWHG